MTKRIRKKIISSIACITASFFISSTFAAAPTFKHIVFFGDSLSDNGNMYSLSHGLLPKYPPYFKGRFSNGYAWSDLVSYPLFEHYGIDSQNYAVGGATATLHNPLKGFLPITLQTEYDKYILDNALKDKSNTLYAIWVGANDYLPGQQNVDQATSAVVNAIVQLVKQLAVNKNAQFLIIDLPDIADSPAANQRNLVNNYKQLYIAHDKKLRTAITQLKKAYPQTSFYQFSFLKNPLIKNIVESDDFRKSFNKKYHVNFTNVTDACWTGGFMETQSAKQIETRLQKNHLMTDTFKISQWIQQSPDLNIVYQTTQLAENHNSACQDPDNHVFWDQLHPSAAVHTVFAKIVLAILLKQ